MQSVRRVEKEQAHLRDELERGRLGQLEALVKGLHPQWQQQLHEQREALAKEVNAQLQQQLAAAVAILGKKVGEIEQECRWLRAHGSEQQRVERERDECAATACWCAHPDRTGAEGAGG